MSSIQKVNRVCPNYTGVSCVNGSCPMAHREEYEEYGIPTINSCEECNCYKGCKDCAWNGTDTCKKEGGKK